MSLNVFQPKQFVLLVNKIFGLAYLTTDHINVFSIFSLTKQLTVVGVSEGGDSMLATPRPSILSIGNIFSIYKTNQTTVYKIRC